MNLRKRLKGVRVTVQLAEQINRAPMAEKLGMLDALDHYRAEFKRGERTQRPSPGGLAAGAHDAMQTWIDDAVANPPAGRVASCQRGCAHCCRLLVSVFPDEATLAMIAADDVGLQVDRERLHRQAEARTTDEWGALSRDDRTCVFLRDEQCAIYEHRPSACRKYMVASPPELCDTDRHPGQEVAVLACNAAEVITSAAITTWGWEPLAAALLRVIDADKNRAS